MDNSTASAGGSASAGGASSESGSGSGSTSSSAEGASGTDSAAAEQQTTNAGVRSVGGDSASGLAVALGVAAWALL